jgi:hypothetical protein
LVIDCGELQAAERLITMALAGDPPDEIALELKDLLVQSQYDRLTEDP